jgi:hypothetical protein
MHRLPAQRALNHLAAAANLFDGALDRLLGVAGFLCLVPDFIILPACNAPDPASIRVMSASASLPCRPLNAGCPDIVRNEGASYLNRIFHHAIF